jgi:hypothetical protein
MIAETGASGLTPAATTRERRPKTEHYVDGEHDCDQRCGPLRDHRTPKPTSAVSKSISIFHAPLCEDARQVIVTSVTGVSSISGATPLKLQSLSGNSAQPVRGNSCHCARYDSVGVAMVL